MTGFVIAGSAYGDPQQQVTTPPKVSNARSQALHICSLGGEYRVGEGWAKFAAPACTRVYRPLTVYVGDRLRVRTLEEASAIRIRSVRHPDRPRPQHSCGRRAPGDWICPMPPAHPSDMEIWLEISYPDALARWSVDVAVRPRARLVVGERRVDTPAVYTEGFLQCLAIRPTNSSRPVFHRCADRLGFDRLLRPGSYRLASYTRPCAGNCNQLDPARNHCARSLRLRGEERLKVIVRVAAGEPCRIRLDGRR